MFIARIAGLTSFCIVELVANKPALMSEDAAMAPLSFFLSSAPRPLSASTAAVHATMPQEPMKRHCEERVRERRESVRGGSGQRARARNWQGKKHTLFHGSRSREKSTRMAFSRVSRKGTYRDFGFFVDLARALAVLVRAEDLQCLLAREREARREVTYDAREGEGCRVSARRC